MPLGKGLSALITSTGPGGRTRHILATGQTGGVGDMGEKVWQIPLTDIVASPDQPRKHFSQNELEELSSSIKEHGIIQPLLCVEKDTGGYELVAGERRLRAAKLAGLTTVPVIVKKLADQTKVEVALIENIQRENLNPIEEAFAFRRLAEEFGLTQEMIAQKVGKSRPAVANAVRLLELPSQIQQSLIEKKISAGQARALLGLSSSHEQLAMLQSMLGKSVSVRETESKVRDQKQKNGVTMPKDSTLGHLERQIGQALGTKVAIKEKGGQGSVTIAFFSKQELGEIVRKITGN